MSDPKATAVEIQRLHREIARLNDENERLNFDYERLASRKLTDEVDAERKLADELATVVAGGLVAMDLTRQYVGEKMLPAVEGWSWFDWTQRAEEMLAHHQEARSS